MKKFARRTPIIILLVWLFTVTASAAGMLIPGGQVVGLELCDARVVVAGFDEEQGKTAQAAGLKSGDVIQKIDIFCN